MLPESLISAFVSLKVYACGKSAVSLNKDFHCIFIHTGFHLREQPCVKIPPCEKDGLKLKVTVNSGAP